jgi:hypothetical protein
MMQFGNAADYGQTQTIATRLSAAALIQSVKRLKNMVHLFLWNTNAIICDTESVVLG